MRSALISGISGIGTCRQYRIARYQPQRGTPLALEIDPRRTQLAEQVGHSSDRTRVVGMGVLVPEALGHGMRQPHLVEPRGNDVHEIRDELA